jgi:hypothetical protein
MTYNEDHDLRAFVQDISANGDWSVIYDTPEAHLNSSEAAFGDVSTRYLASAIQNFKAGELDSQEANPGIQVVVEDVRLVLILDDPTVKGLINGMNIAAGVAAAFAAATAAIAAVLATNKITIPASVLGVFISAIAGIFSGFVWAASALLGELNKGNGVYLTVTIPQLIASAILILASILLPLTAWITFPLAVAAMIIIPTTRP